MEIEDKLIEDLSGALTDCRPVPFWSWNDKLEEGELRRQVRQMHAVGMGGFFMHARGGLETEYLSEDWFRCIEIGMDEAEKCGMNAWAYDENGWPSGFAGMKLLEEKENLCHYLRHGRGRFDPGALCCFVRGEDRLVRTQNPDEADCLLVYDCVNPSVVDVQNPEVVDRFLAETHERYFRRFGVKFDRLAGFFTDEPQYFRWETAYTPLMIEAYAQEYGDSLLDGLGLLFEDAAGCCAFRFRYWRMMNKLFTENFGGRVYRWCEAHGTRLTGHAVEESSLFGQMWCCAGVMPFYRYEHVPGIDWLAREIGSAVSPRQVSSVAAQFGKRQVLTETFGCCGWDVTPAELKRVAEWQYVHGVNLMCQHLMSYSIRGQRKRDYPMSFSEHTPWYPFLREFNGYFTRLGYLLSSGPEPVEVAVLHPMHSAYLLFHREEEDCLRGLDDAFAHLTERLGALQIAHHYLDETLLEQFGRVEGDRLILGQCAYRTVILPQILGLDFSTAKRLKEFMAGGGRLLLTGDAPRYVDGEQADLSWLKSNTDERTLCAESPVRLSDAATPVRSCLRDTPYGRVAFFVNLSETETVEDALWLSAPGLTRVDLLVPALVPCSFVRKGGGVELPLKLLPGESALFLLGGEPAPAAPIPRSAARELDLRQFTVALEENALTLDTAYLSYDGKEYAGPYPVPGLFELLIRRRENRTVYVKYTARAERVPDRCRLECERMRFDALWVNGARVDHFDPGRLDGSFLSADVATLMREGTNEFVFRVQFQQSPHVYRVLLDSPEGTESLKNCLSYDTELESVYLFGDFGVKSNGKFTQAPHRAKVTEGGFALVKAPALRGADDLVESGYPFYTGAAQYCGEFCTDGKKTLLRLSGRYAVAEVCVNGHTRTLLFSDTVDVTQDLVPGKNRLSVRLVGGNRNLLGPHHCEEPEPYAVGPYQFDFAGTWSEGYSPAYRASYSFVQFGLDKIEILS